MKYYHVEENGNILTLESEQPIRWAYWNESLQVAIETARRDLHIELSLAKDKVVEKQNKLDLFEKRIKENDLQKIQER